MERSSSRRICAFAYFYQQVFGICLVAMGAGLTATTVQAQAVTAPSSRSQSAIQSVLTQKRDSLQQPASADSRKPHGTTLNSSDRSAGREKRLLD
jgi:hypothetical protein